MWIWARATLAAIVAVVVGVGGAGGTYALLSVTTPFSGATLTAGTLGLQLNGASSASLDAFAVSPNTPVAKPFSVTITGDVPATLRADITADSTSITSYARARITRVTDTTACAINLTGSQGALQGYSETLGGGSLAAGATRWYCFEVALATNTPATVSGEGLTFTVTITGTQSEN
ncbi:MAG: hypothetical protein QM695_08735 [Micropruina sp.]